MSDGYDWAFSARDDAKAEIRVAVRFLLKGAAGTDRDLVALEIMEKSCARPDCRLSRIPRRWLAWGTGSKL